MASGSSKARFIGLVDNANGQIPAHAVHVLPHLDEKVASRRQRHPGRIARGVAGPIVPRRVRRIEEDQRREQHDHGHGLGEQRETQEKGGGARIVAPHPSEQAVDPHETSLKSHSRHLRIGLAIWDGAPSA
jgi:hypothetical protein